MKRLFVKGISFFIRLLRLEVQVDNAAPLPIMLVAHEIERNIEASRNELMLRATERMIETHILNVYPYIQAKRYAVQLRWAIFFKSIELGCNPKYDTGTAFM